MNLRPLNFLARLFGLSSARRTPTSRPSVGEFMSCVRAPESPPATKPRKDPA